eukprot:scaffold2138_cov124-Pinguiococcus_pyrenoidosus.AAC.1
MQVERAAAEAAAGMRDAAQLRRLLQQAQTALERAEVNGASADVERGLALAPADHQLWNLKVGALIQQRRYAKAVEAAESAARVCHVARTETVWTEQKGVGAEVSWAFAELMAAHPIPL